VVSDFGILGLVDVFYTTALQHGRSLIIACLIVVSIIYGFIHARPRRVERTFASPNMTIRVVPGDLFEQPGHLVIGMCNTFDTSIPVIIDRRSIQGQFLERVFDGDAAEFDRQLDVALADATILCEIEKPGKQFKYAIGEVATIVSGNRRYFCVAYTDMNEKNEARGSVAGILQSMDRLWEAVSAYGNGEVVAIPVIGGGQARVAHVLPARDSIRLMILSFVLASRKEKVCNGLDIIVRPEDYEKLDRLEIQAFLDSLTGS
jgi:hypothetical protein